MARLKQNVVEERNNFVLDFFKKNPGATVQKANEALKGQYGAMMRPQKAYLLKKQATGQSATNDAPKRRGRPPKAKQPQNVVIEAQRTGTTTVGPMEVVVVRGSETQFAFLHGCLAQIKEAGLANLEIEYANDRIAVVGVR